jgi:hypothetical protein
MHLNVGTPHSGFGTVLRRCLQPLEQLLTCTRHDAVGPRVAGRETGNNFVRPKHRVRLAGSRLAIRKDRRVEAIKDGSHATARNYVVGLLLCLGPIENPVERELKVAELKMR